MLSKGIERRLETNLTTTREQHHATNNGNPFFSSRKMAVKAWGWELMALVARIIEFPVILIIVQPFRVVVFTSSIVTLRLIKPLNRFDAHLPGLKVLFQTTVKIPCLFIGLMSTSTMGLIFWPEANFKLHQAMKLLQKEQLKLGFPLVKKEPPKPEIEIEIPPLPAEPQAKPQKPPAGSAPTAGQSGSPKKAHPTETPPKKAPSKETLYGRLLDEGDSFFEGCSEETLKGLQDIKIHEAKVVRNHNWIPGSPKNSFAPDTSIPQPPFSPIRQIPSTDNSAYFNDEEEPSFIRDMEFDVGGENSSDNLNDSEPLIWQEAVRTDLPVKQDLDPQGHTSPSVPRAGSANKLTPGSVPKSPYVGPEPIGVHRTPPRKGTPTKQASDSNLYGTPVLTQDQLAAMDREIENFNRVKTQFKKVTQSDTPPKKPQPSVPPQDDSNSGVFGFITNMASFAKRKIVVHEDEEDKENQLPQQSAKKVPAKSVGLLNLGDSPKKPFVLRRVNVKREGDVKEAKGSGQIPVAVPALTAHNPNIPSATDTSLRPKPSIVSRVSYPQNTGKDASGLSVLANLWTN